MDRIALVIGNSDYSNVGKLNNPKNDADDIASILNKLNFDVTKIMDAKIAEVETLQGTVIKRYFINNNQVNISTLPSGTYRLSGVNHKGCRHLLGTFTKKENKKK